MKYLLLHILILSLSISGYTQSDLEEKGLLGKVKSYREKVFKIDDSSGKIEKVELQEDVFSKFNQVGNQIKKNLYNSDGSLNYKYTYKYNLRGNQIKKNLHASDGSLSSKTTYKYDSKGNKIEENLYESDGSLHSKYNWKYDDRDNEIEEVYIGSKNIETITTNKYTYDSKDNWIKKIEYNNSFPKELTERTIEYYD